MKSKFIRIKWKTWVKLRQLIPKLRNESASEYFDRIARAWEYNEIEEHLNEKRFKTE